MKRILALNAGPASVRLRTNDRAVAEFLERRYSEYLNDSDPGAMLDISVNSSLDFKNPTAFKIEADDSSLAARSSAASLEWDFKARRGKLEVAPMHLYFPIENTLRILFSRLELEAGATLVHAAAIIGKGFEKAALFPGRSGAGKSTLATEAAAAGAVALGDDLVVLVKSKNGWTVASTPFAGVDSPRPHNRNAPLGMIAFLGGRGGTELKPVRTTEAAAALAACIPFPDALRGRSGKTALGLAAEAVKSVPVFRANRLKGEDPAPLWEAAR
jgi:hypothetical protein